MRIKDFISGALGGVALFAILYGLLLIGHGLGV